MHLRFWPFLKDVPLTNNSHWLWILRGPGIPSVYKFETCGGGAAGLVGAIGAAVFTGRDSGGQLRITFGGEVMEVQV